MVLNGCSQEQIDRAARAARAVGGYHELVRLAGEMQEYPKGEADYVKQADGSFKVVPRPGWQRREKARKVRALLGAKRNEDRRRAYWWMLY